MRSLIVDLFRHRFRPRFGSKLWAKYWAKRVLLLGALFRASRRIRKYRRRGATIGDRTIISPANIGGQLRNLSIGHDCAIGRVEIQLHAAVTIGDCVVINDGSRLLTGTHDIHSPQWELVAKPIVVEDYVWIATGSTVLPGVTIGRGAVVGAGSVVSKSVAPMTVVAGNPAREVGRRTATELQYRPSESNALFEAWLGPPRPRADVSQDK